MTEPSTVILIVDDNPLNRELLSRRVQQQGHSAVAAENGRQGLAILQQQAIDVVFLDIMMPEMNGYETLEHIKGDPILRHIPVIMISAVDDMDSVVRCIELGADDYLFKPFNPVLLRARLAASLEKKRLRDNEQAYARQLEIEQEKSERLLLNILPPPIAARLKAGGGIIADSFPDVTILFADLVDFTPLASRVPPHQLVAVLNTIFSCFDDLADQYGLEKIKTMGDSYMLAGGIPLPQADHAAAVAEMALAMQAALLHLDTGLPAPFQMRIGIDSGPVVAGVIGTRKFIYDLWGDTVNTASRMEAHGIPNAIQVTAATHARLQAHYHFTPRGPVEIKGKGMMTTYLLTGRK